MSALLSGIGGWWVKQVRFLLRPNIQEGGCMFGFSTADWLFCGFVLIVIFVCVAISDMRKKKG